MSRLVNLLRYFRVPANASYSELRQAYLQRVKHVHPDTSTEETAADFRQLQQNFEEAVELLRQRDIEGGTRAHAATWHIHKGDITRAEAYKAQKQGYENRTNPNVPAVGFSAQPVYATASIFVAATASFLLSQRRQPSPSVAEGTRSSKPLVEKKSPEKDLPAENSYTALRSGAWSVADAKEAAQNSKTVWAPSKAWEFQDSDSFYGLRTKGHMRPNIGQRQAIGREQGKQVKVLGYEAYHEPQVRDDVTMLPVHIAAADGHVWWLELCGASLQCRGLLSTKDSMGDTPLHHSVRKGQDLASLTLLRLGADTEALNLEGLLPKEVAASSCQEKIATLLVKAGNVDAESTAIAHRHPDGFGIHAQPPESVIFTGLESSGCMRRAVNMAAGCIVAPPLPVSKGIMDFPDAADRMVNVACGSLQCTEFDLEEIDKRKMSDLPPGQGIWSAFESQESELCGLLLYEPPGAVTADSPGHWVAIRPVPATPVEEFFRLDPVRGPFKISTSDLTALVSRYRAWCVVRKGEDVLAARAQQLAAAQEEASAVLRKRGGVE